MARETMITKGFVQLNFYVSKAQFETLKEISKETGKTASAILRDALQMYIGGHLLARGKRGVGDD